MRLTLALFFVLLLGSALRAEDPKPIEIVLRARAIESPPLKYQLLPNETELKPGNAAPILLRLPWEQTHWMNQVFPKLHEWEERPLTAPEWETSGGVLPENFFSEMKRAAFRREATWEYPIGETQSLYMILLPDVQGLRGFLVAGLSARIRYHLSRGELEQAREGILVGLANGRHVAQTPFFINQLVALVVHRVMLDRVGEMISQPNSPNLYWALSTLPDSLVAVDRAASLEAHAFAVTLPGVNDLDRPRDVKEWRKMAKQLLELLEQLGEIPKLERPKEDASLLEQLMRTLDESGRMRLTMFVKDARADLPKLLKIPEEKVAAMSDEEACIRWYVHLRLTRDQQMAAVLMLPPREAWPRIAKLQAEVKSMKGKMGGRSFDFLDPTNFYISTRSLKRKIQMLRIVEAVRDYLATHDGKLPKTLDEIKGVPIPLDALTEQPFLWKVEGKVATLKAPPLPAIAVEPGSAADKLNVLEYRLEVK